MVAVDNLEGFAEQVREYVWTALWIRPYSRPPSANTAPAGSCPPPQELLASITQLEIAAFGRGQEIPDNVLATAWLLHGLAAVEPEAPGFDPVRTRQAPPLAGLPPPTREEQVLTPYAG